MNINGGMTFSSGLSVAPASATVPDAPTIGTAVASSPTSAFVPFTAPANDGESIITSYVATSNPGNLSNTIYQANSGNITVSGLSELTSYTFTVVAKNGLGSSVPSSPSNSITTPSINYIPVNTALPVITGTPNFGQTLALSTGTWAANPSASYTYQWQRNSSNVAGATNNRYDVTQDDVGYTIRGIVIATNNQGNATATSNPTATVSAVVPSAPFIGTATSTGLTTATVAFTSPGSNGGANIATYTATSTPGNITGTLNQAGSGIIDITGLTSGVSYTFTVTATNSVGTSVASSASNSITTFTVPVNTVAPVVSGTLRFGSTLSCTTGTWTGTSPITYTYQWQRAGSNISGAVNSNYDLIQADVGYTISCVVTGTNAYGNSTADSNITSNIIAILPGAPIIGTATSTGLSSATVTYTAPASNGGSDITSYTATSSPGGFVGIVDQSGSGTITVNNLSPGVSYTFTVTATNSIGTGNASSASNSITTFTTPVNTVAPVVSGTTKFGSTLSCTTGTWTGTATINYTYQWQRTGVNIPSATSSTYVLVQDDVGSRISCIVTGTNPYGASNATSNSTAIIGALVPGAPTIGTATPISPTTATVDFTAPSDNGGAVITSYTATSSPGNITGTLSQSGSGTITVTGLTQGTSYTFTVKATNSIGSSSASSASNSITTYVAPSNTVVPVLSGTASFGQTLSSSTGTWTGTAPISYTYQWSRDLINISGATSSSYTVVQADMGARLRCTVTGTNLYGSAIGTSSPTDFIRAVAPGAPTIGTATATGTTTATVEFTAPASNGGATITQYIATSSVGDVVGTLNQSGSGTIPVYGLSPATNYTFRVAAKNSAGTGVQSSSSNLITTYASPVNTVAPFVSGTTKFGSTLSSTTGTWTGTAPISYTYQWQRSGSNISGATSSTYTLVQADIGNQLKCRVTATNTYGSSTANSNTTALITPSVPGAPTIGTAVTAGATGATVSFTAPASDGGGVITSYTATSSPGNITGTVSQAGSGSIVVTGLTTGVTYTFTVKATNSAGSSSASAASNSLTTLPATPNVDYLVVAGAGGGGGGAPRPSGCGGGGAGGFRTASGLSVTSGVSISVTVGAGGRGGTGSSTTGASGTKGSNSVFSSITSTGGGGGSGTSILGPTAASALSNTSGGSGGGGAGCTSPISGASGNTPSTSPAQGFGGAGGTSSSPFVGGGGGGAGGTGTTSATRSGGGPGVSNSLTGSANTYSIGGNNGVGSTYLGGASGASNTGNGGGGASSIQSTPMSGGSGGSGIVVIRYPDTYALAASTFGNPTVTTTGGYRIYTYTSSGSITF